MNQPASLIKMPAKPEIIGNSEIFTSCIKETMKASETPLPILLLGETGTGKELFAKLIHRNNQKKDLRPAFFVFNCAAFPDGNLAKSSLFGHRKGFFTGASSDAVGIFERANGGIVFLDEISELSLEIQAALLRVLEDGSFNRLGESETRNSNFRFIAASNKDLLKEVALGNFRQDLFYRLDGFTIKIPPLRERKPDIPVLAEHFKHLARRDEIIFSQKALSLMEKYPWPGNVRELKTAVERAIALCDGKIISPEDLRLENPNKLNPSAQSKTIIEMINECPVEHSFIKEMEKINFLTAFKKAYESPYKTTDLLKIDLRQFRYLRDKYVKKK